MSGTASRYIAGVPYGPGMGVGRYPSAASVLAPPGVRPGGSYTPPAVDARGIAIDPSTGAVAMPIGTQEGDLDLTNLLLQAGLGVLGAAPEIYDVASRMFGGAEELPTPPEFVSAEEAARRNGVVPAEVGGPPGASVGSPVSIPQGGAAAPITGTPNISVKPDIFSPMGGADLAPAQGLMPAPEGLVPLDLPVDKLSYTPDLAPGGQTAADAVQGGSFAALPAEDPFGLTGSLGQVGGFDIATGLADLAGGAAGGWAASQYAAGRREPNAGYGQQIGSTIGGIVGSFIPVPVLGTAVGAALGGVLGTEIGGSVGAPPTIGRNFGIMGTLGGDGQIYWGQGGGDNGGTAADATGFANDFGRNLLQMASAQGLRFNPATAGAQFTIGGFDNFSRRGETPGGFFYDPYNGASPENYALRPGWDDPLAAFSPQQADAFTRAVLQDLAARNVFTPTGTGENLFNASAAGGLGFYGSGGLSYSDPAQGTAFQGNTGNFLTDVMYRQADLRAGNVMAQQAAAEQARQMAEWQAANAATGNPTMTVQQAGAGFGDPGLYSGGA